MRLTFVVAVLSSGCLLLAACATPATKVSQTATAASAPQQTAANADNPMICSSVEVTGSRMPVRECHTAAEWARIKSQGLDQISIEAQRSLANKGGN